MSESFYGGRRGASFILVKSYSSIQELITDFGKESCEVGYGEYAFIKSVNAEENGKIFRREDMSLENNGAIYSGQLGLNDAEASPVNIELSTVDLIEKMQGAVVGTYDADNTNYIPGVTEKDDKTIVNSKVKWATCYTPESGVTFVGFKFPYTVFNFSVESSYNGQAKAENLSTPDKPFYQNWRLTVPSGRNGSSVSDLRVITASPIDRVEPYEGQALDRQNAARILIYTLTEIVENQEVVKYYYVGKYQMVESIRLADNGSIMIKYFNTPEQELGKLKYLSDVVIDDENGKMTFTYNTGETEDKTFIFVKNVSITTDEETRKRTLKFTKSDGSEVTTDFNFLTNLFLNPTDKKFYVTYNEDEETTVAITDALNYIEQSAITSDFHLVFNYYDKSKNVPPYEGIDTAYANWADLGIIKDNSGLLIGYRYRYDDEGMENPIGALNELYPTGTPTGKCVAITQKDNSNNLYAFDYNSMSWFYLGNLNSGGGGGGNASVIVGTVDEKQSEFDESKIGTIWFVVAS